MEMAEGSLHELLDASLAEEGKAVDRGDLCPLLAQAAEALDFLNTRRHRHEDRLVAIQHCDIKPSNLLLFGDTVKLADFGLATVTSQYVQFKRPAGTPAYMAPELMMGRISDRSDQFSLAVTYVQMRTGKLPWPEEEPDPDRQTWPVPDLSGLQAKERVIISRALSNVAQERWPNCKEMMAHLADGPDTAFMLSKPTQQGTATKPTLHGQVKPLC
jgi:serine/threonine protein kinase